jgi:hypothetical protein
MILIKLLMIMALCTASLVTLYVFMLVNKEIDNAWEKFRKGKS